MYRLKSTKSGVTSLMIGTSLLRASFVTLDETAKRFITNVTATNNITIINPLLLCPISYQKTESQTNNLLETSSQPNTYLSVFGMTSLALGAALAFYRKKDN